MRWLKGCWSNAHFIACFTKTIHGSHTISRRVHDLSFFCLFGLFFIFWFIFCYVKLKKEVWSCDIHCDRDIPSPWWHLPTHAACACLRCLSPEPIELIYGRILVINGLSQGRIRPSTSTLPAWKGDRAEPGTAFEIVAIVMLKPKIKRKGDRLSQQF